MRGRKEIIHDLFELRSKILLVNDINERTILNEEILKVKKELVDISLKEAQNNIKKGR